MKTQTQKMIEDFQYIIGFLDMGRDAAETVDGVQYFDTQIAKVKAYLDELEAPGKVSQVA